MRHLYILYPNIVQEKQPMRKRKTQATVELAEQKQINAELIRICEHQRRLLAEQSGMIEEILETMGR